MDIITRAKRIVSDHCDGQVAYTSQRLVAEGKAYWDFDPADPVNVWLVQDRKSADVLVAVDLSTSGVTVEPAMNEHIN